MTTPELREPRVAEFFAGIGLVGRALEGAGFDIVFANDVDAAKKELFEFNFPKSVYLLRDIRDVGADDVPDIDMATASFPCTDLSLAGNRMGLSGTESGMFWEFTRVIEEMGHRRPLVLLLENVIGFATSHGGADFASAVARLNELGYSCDVLVVDARRFVPQSRPRLFIVASLDRDWPSHAHLAPCWARPQWVVDLLQKHRQLVFHAASLPVPEELKPALGDILEDVPPADARWWNLDRVAAFVSSLSGLQLSRLEQRVRADSISAKTAYRRTRQGKATWEMRQDDLAGCLRTTRGGSSKQALVVAGQGMMRVRWMTPLEYARLQGAGGFRLDGIRENRAYFAFGDAVCVPVVAWLGEHYLLPLVQGRVADLKGFVDGLEADGQRPVSASAAAR